jgi:hypothetical protein
MASAKWWATLSFSQDYKAGYIKKSRFVQLLSALGIDGLTIIEVIDIIDRGKKPI